MAKKNEAIGEVECPAKLCVQRVPVFRFRERESESMRRFAGKLYCRCPSHGQFGGAAGDQAMQDYLLEHATIWPRKSTDSDETLPVNQPAVPAVVMPANPQKLPAKTTTTAPAELPASTAKQSRGWGFFP